MSNLDEILKEIDEVKEGVSRQKKRKIWKKIWKVSKDEIEGKNRAEKRRNWKAYWERIVTK